MPHTGKRILIVTGHYGSGKTEFAVSLAMLLRQSGFSEYSRLAIIDIDIANPYFRSRERTDMLNAAGISVYGNFYEYEITAELPALSAAIRAPLEDKDCFVIVDVGGNDSGARILNQYTEFFTGDEHAMLAVVNANRPDTATVEGALFHLNSIEKETGIPIDYIVNNCHLLMETTADTIAKGHAFCEKVCEASGKKLWCDCYPAKLVHSQDLYCIGEHPMPIGMYMRQSWLDK